MRNLRQRGAGSPAYLVISELHLGEGKMKGAELQLRPLSGG